MGLNASEIVSVAGLRVMPDLSLGGFVKDSAAILILPGGNFWTQGELPEVSQAVRAVIDENRPAAAICRRPWHSRTAACSTTAAHQQRARVHGSVCEKLSRGGVLPAFF